jgi:PAS domain S-box-containing protein
MHDASEDKARCIKVVGWPADTSRDSDRGAHCSVLSLRTEASRALRLHFGPGCPKELMRLSTEAKIRAGFGVAFLTLTGLGIVAYQSTTQLLSTMRWVAHTHTVIEGVQTVLADVIRIRADMRGYVIVGDDELIAGLQGRMEQVRRDVHGLRTLTADNANQQHRLDALDALLGLRFAFTDEVIAAYRTKGAAAAAALVRSRRGIELSASIEQVIRQIVDEEHALLRRRDAEVSRDARWTILTVLIGTVLTSLLLGAAATLIHRDMTQRQHAEVALRESEARLQAVMDNTSAIIHLKDPQGRIMLANRSFLEVIGREASQVVGRPDHEALPPERLGLFREHDQAVLAADGPLSFDVIAPGADGPRAYVAVKCALRDASGVPYAICTVATDITDRMHAEEEADRLRRFLDSIIENIPNMVFVKDAEALRFVRLNRAGEELLGYSRDDLIGKNDYDFFPREQADSFTAKDRAVLEGQAPVDIPEESIATRVRGERILHTKKVPILDRDGTPRFLLGISEDVTERKRSEREVADLNERLRAHAEQLATSNQELEAFSYSVSHDLRAPLRHIVGFTDLLQRHAAATFDDQARRYLDTITRSAGSMAALIDDLLAFSRMGRAEMRKTRINLGQMVAEVIAECEAGVDGRRIVWQLGEMPAVEADPPMLRLALANLIANAIKYTGTRETAKIEVGAETRDGELVVSVRDNGVGFDMEYRDKLFGVFQRLHTAEEFEGTGIGLANVRRIVQRHGGRTWAEGAIDRGAAFFFTLPHYKEAA